MLAPVPLERVLDVLVELFELKDELVTELELVTEEDVFELTEELETLEGDLDETLLELFCQFLQSILCCLLAFA